MGLYYADLLNLSIDSIKSNELICARVLTSHAHIFCIENIIRAKINKMRVKK